MPLRCQAAVQYRDVAIGFKRVMGFGLRTVALEVHRQTGQLVPGALVALEVDAVGRLGRQRVRARRGTASQHQAGKKDDQ
ncbi:hypothetical protein D3C85_1827090 [compost metagenome]